MKCNRDESKREIASLGEDEINSCVVQIGSSIKDTILVGRNLGERLVGRKNNIPGMNTSKEKERQLVEMNQFRFALVCK